MDILGYAGLAAAFLLSIAIVTPILIRSLRQQNALARHAQDHGIQEPQDPGRSAISPPAPYGAISCAQCGQVNRVPLDAPRALCGRCQHELVVAQPVA